MIDKKLIEKIAGTPTVAPDTAIVVHEGHEEEMEQMTLEELFDKVQEWAKEVFPIDDDETFLAADEVTPDAIPEDECINEYVDCGECNEEDDYDDDADDAGDSDWLLIPLPTAMTLPPEVADSVIEMAEKAIYRFRPGEYYLLSNSLLHESKGIIHIDSIVKEEDDFCISYHAVVGFSKDLSEYEEDQTFLASSAFATCLTHIPFTAGTHPDNFKQGEGVLCGGCKFLGRLVSAGIPGKYLCEVCEKTVAINDICSCPDLLNDEALRLVQALALYTK